MYCELTNKPNICPITYASGVRVRVPRNLDPASNHCPVLVYSLSLFDPKMILVVEIKLLLSPFQLCDENPQVVRILIDRFRYDLDDRALEIIIHRAPDQLNADEGPHFKNELVETVVNLDDCQHVFSTQSHHQAKGQTERWNSMIVDGSS